VAERQGDDAGRQNHYYPGHVVSGCQLGPQPTVAPKVSLLGEPLELRWIIHPDKHLSACAAPKPPPLLGWQGGGLATAERSAPVPSLRLLDVAPRLYGTSTVSETVAGLGICLAAASPDRYRPDLAVSLSNLGAWLSVLGQDS
jgi:hypothetical protein